MRAGSVEGKDSRSDSGINLQLSCWEIHRTVVDRIATSDKVKTRRLREMIDSLYWRSGKGFSVFFFPSN